VLLIAQYVREGQRLSMIYADTDPEAYVLHVITLVLAAVATRPILSHVLAEGDGAAQASRRIDQELFRMTKTALFVPDLEER
jgi:hypothetical protein